MWTVIQEPLRCKHFEYNYERIAILYGVISLIGILGTILYSCLAMNVVELSFPCSLYTSKLERAYRRRHQALCQYNETIIGENPDIDPIAARLAKKLPPPVKRQTETTAGSRNTSTQRSP